MSNKRDKQPKKQPEFRKRKFNLCFTCSKANKCWRRSQGLGDIQTCIEYENIKYKK